MGNLIGSNANDIVKAATINNALLSQKNTVSQKSLLKSPKLRVDDNTMNPNAAAQVTITNLQGLSQYLGLYNNKGVVPVASLNKADNEANTKISTSDTRINYVLKSNINSIGAASSWTANTVVNGAFVASGSDVRVDILNSDSGYDNKIYWSTDDFQTKNYLGIDNQGGSYDLGSFAAGTQIKFAIDNGVGGFYQTGSPSANPDNYQHAKFTTTASGTKIGFEDLDGGGDQDFNDAIIQVKNVNQPPKNESQLNQATKQYNEVDSKQNQAPVETVNKSKLVFKSVLKGSDLKSLANDKFIHPSEINKNLVGSAHNIDLHSDQTKINFINSYNTKKTQDNLTTQDYFNTKFTLDSFKAHNERNINQIQQTGDSKRYSPVASQRDNASSQIDEGRDYFFKDNTLQLSKSRDNEHINHANEINQEQEVNSTKKLNQELANTGNKPGNSIAAQILNNFLQKNIS